MGPEPLSPLDHATILLVDDDPSVIKSLQRAMRRSNYRVLTAHSGTAALAILEHETVNLVVSDARMPHMDGSTLLAEVSRRWPNCVRILLTGYVDAGTIIKAINDGEIYRYVTKPWNDEELRLVIGQSLEHSYAQHERVRLQQLTQEQNRALQELNESLESRVRSRTAELASTAKLLDDAYVKLQRSYVTATEVFSSLTNRRLPINRQTNQKVITLVRAYCAAHEVDRTTRQNLEMAAALYNIGKLTWSDEMIALPSERLESNQREEYRDYPRIGEELLIALEPAQDAALIVRHHQERWDGAGFPDGLIGESIPWSSRLLKLAVDFTEMQMGMVLARSITPAELLEIMPQYAGRLYDPQLCQRFLELVSGPRDDPQPEDATILTVNSNGLRPGMIMVRNLYGSDGMLLLGEGNVITERLVERLQMHEANERASYEFHVRRPDQETS